MIMVLDSSDAIGWFLLTASAVKILVASFGGRGSRVSKDEMAAATEDGSKILVGRVSKLFIYPVKSMAGIEVKSLNCRTAGGAIEKFSDRQFLVVTGEDKLFVTARTVPQLLLIQPKLNDNQLTLTVNGFEPIHINLGDVERNNNLCKTSVHGSAAVGLDCGDMVADWLNSFLQKDSAYRLLYLSPSIQHRLANAPSVKYAKWTANLDPSAEVNYQDSSAYHLLCLSSVEDLNKKLKTPITVANFRPNIVVTDAPPFSEDTWNKVYMGDTEMSIIKLCSRCVLTTVDPSTGVKLASEEPLQTLRIYRKLVPTFGESPCLGINLFLHKEGTINVGDPVYAVYGQPKLVPPGS